MKHFIKSDLVSCDTETTGLDVWHGDRPFAFSFFNRAGDSAYFEWPVNPFNRQVIPNRSEWRQIKRFYEDTTIKKVFHHAKFDVRMLSAIGIDVCGPGGSIVYDGGEFDDTMIKAWCFNNIEPNLKLKSLACRYGNYPQDDEDELDKAVVKLRRHAKKLGWKIAFEKSFPILGKFKRDGVIEADKWLPSAFYNSKQYRRILRKLNIDPNVCKTYALGDVERTTILDMFYEGGLKERINCESTYQKELKLWPYIYRMEEIGVRVDRDILQQSIAEGEEKLKDHLAYLRKKAWKDFNPESWQQVAKLLYDVLKVQNQDTEASGHYLADKSSRGTDQDTLAIYTHHPEVQRVLSFRTVKKSVGTYYGPYTRLAVDDNNGAAILHTDFQQVGPVTGRLADRRPNLQNVHKPEASDSIEAVQARKPFIPRDGYAWTLADYANLEMRIYAVRAQEKNMISWFLSDEPDIHGRMCNMVWGGKKERAILNAVDTLDFNRPKPSDGVKSLWSDLGIKNIRTVNLSQKMKWAADWLSQFEYNIVKAEESIGKETTRKRTKSLNFLKIFGGEAKAAAAWIKCPYQEAKGYLVAYDETFPDMREYQKEETSKAQRLGYVLNSYGERLAVDRDRAYTTAVNYGVQGSAARLMKESMRKVGALFDDSGLDIRMLLTIHDELISEWYKKHFYQRLVLEMVRLMEDSDRVFAIPIKVDVKTTSVSWAETKNYYKNGRLVA